MVFYIFSPKISIIKNNGFFTKKTVSQRKLIMFSSRGVDAGAGSGRTQDKVVPFV